MAMAAVEFSPVPSCAEPVSSAVTGLHVNCIRGLLFNGRIYPMLTLQALRLWDSYGTSSEGCATVSQCSGFRYIDKYVRTAQGYNTDVIITLGFPPVGLLVALTKTLFMG